MYQANEAIPEGNDSKSEDVSPRDSSNVRIVYKPVVSSGSSKSIATSKQNDDPFIRAENEDDDGYDPYSDRVEHTELFEEDPWR